MVDRLPLAPCTEIVGIDMVLPDRRGRIWLDTNTGLKVLYGRNGAGKSTIIEGLRALLSGRSRDDFSVNCFVRLPDADLEARAMEGNEDARVLLSGRESGAGMDPPNGWLGRLSAIPERNCRDFWSASGIDHLELARILEGLGLAVDLEMTERLLSEGEPFRRFQWKEVSRLILSATIALERFEGYGRELCSGEGDGGLPVRAMIEIADSRLICIRPAGGRDRPSWLLTQAVCISGDTPNFRALQEDTRKHLRQLAADKIPAGELSTDRLAALVEYWETTLDHHNHLPTRILASKTNIEEFVGVIPSAGRPYQSVDGLGLGLDSIEGWPEFVDLDRHLDPNDLVLQQMIQLADRRHARHTQGTQIWPKQKPKEDGPPYGFIDLSEVEELIGPVQNRQEVSLRWAGPDPGNLKFELEWPDLEILKKDITRVGKTLVALDIGVDGLRLKVEESLSGWLAGPPAHLEALDHPTGKWVGMSHLSDAQLKWVCNTLAIVQAVSTGRPLALLGDEVDAGVHKLASGSIFRYLATQPGIGFVSTHSVAALQTTSLLQVVGVTRAQNVHAGRMTTGELAKIAGVDGPDEPAENAEQASSLGIDETDLLGMRHLFIVVEGEHDKIVINELICGQIDIDPIRVDIIAGRGTKAMKAVTDAPMLIQYTKARILVVVDNANSSKFQPTVDKLRDLIAEGVKADEAIRRSGLTALRNDSTPEERFLVDLLSDATQKGVLHRIDFYGLPGRDIVNLLPPSSFGLQRPWRDLGIEYRRSDRKRSFKDFVENKHGKPINNQTVKEAVSSLDEIPKELGDLLQAISDSMVKAVLDRGI